MTSRQRTTLPALALTLTLALSPVAISNPAPNTFNLWPSTPPGPHQPDGTERDTTKPTDDLIAGRPVIRLGNVSTPTLTLYRPAPAMDTGTTVLVCPGGGYYILAMDLEGTEVCEWLNSIGVTGALLKYRVPRTQGSDRPPIGPLQDAQRALSLLRHRATDLKINPSRIGILGFSAGAHLAASASANYSRRAYPAIDAADQLSCRPDFAVLIYPGYLTVQKENDRVAPDLPLTTNTPPTFLSMTQDDPVRVENALLFALTLKQAGVSTELHIYPSGGHGYGLRRTQNPATHWPDRVRDWMTHHGWVSPSPGL